MNKELMTQQAEKASPSKNEREFLGYKLLARALTAERPERFSISLGVAEAILNRTPPLVKRALPEQAMVHGGAVQAAIDDRYSNQMQSDKPFVIPTTPIEKRYLLNWLLRHPREAKTWLGGKGAGIATLACAGFNVPAFGVVPTQLMMTFRDAFGQNQEAPAKTSQQAKQHITEILIKILTAITYMHHPHEHEGEVEVPLVAVRSGAPASMPGMMKTIINVGLTPDSIDQAAATIGKLPAWRAYQQLLRALAQHHPVNQDKFVVPEGADDATLLKIYQADVAHVCSYFTVRNVTTGKTRCLMDDYFWQLIRACAIVYQSYADPKTLQYAEAHGLFKQGLFGTAIVIMVMVQAVTEYADQAGAGVLFTADRHGNFDKPVITFAQQQTGESVVGESAHKSIELTELPAELQTQLRQLLQQFASIFDCTQDVEFVFDGEQLHVTQTRDAHLPPTAAVRYIFQAIAQGAISEEDALRVVTTPQLHALSAPYLDDETITLYTQQGDLLCQGDGVGVGDVSGMLVAREKLGSIADPIQAIVLYLDTLDQVDVSSLIPNGYNVVGLVIGNLSHGSHASRHLETLNIPVVCGVHTLLAESQIVTISAAAGCVFRGELPLTTAPTGLITPEQDATVQEWKKAKQQNPWRYVYLHPRNNQHAIDALQSELVQTDAPHESLKAREYAAFNDLFPARSRIPYEIVSFNQSQPENTAGQVRAMVKEYLANGSHATIRTGHKPQLAGGGPYVVFTKNEEVDNFFDHPDSTVSRWGGFSQFVQDQIDPESGSTHQLTELLVGKIPKDKLSKDGTIKRQHCVYSVTISEQGNISLSVIPGTPYLRDFETISPENDPSIHVTIRPNEINSAHHKLNPVYGSALERDLLLKQRAERFLQVVLLKFVNEWLPSGLCERLAVLQDQFPREAGHRIIVLEGQARMPEQFLNGFLPVAELLSTETNEDFWMLWYGIKADDL